MEAGSGMDNGSNATIFSCRNSQLSSTGLTNETVWEVEDDNKAGTIIVGVILVIFLLVGLTWNMFIIITYLVKHQLLKEPGNIFLFNLAITDALICSTTMVANIVAAFGGEFLFGSTDVVRCAMCKFFAFFLDFTTLVSFHLLCALSVDRFLHMREPLRYTKLVNQTKAVVVCLFVYFLCFVLTILPIVDLFGEIEFNGRFAACVPRFSPFSNLLYVVVVAVEVCIPVTILIVTSFVTFKLIRGFLKRNFRRRSTFRRRGHEEEDQSNEASTHQKKQLQLLKVFGAFYIANIVSYTPVIVMIFIVLALELATDIVPPSEIYTFAFLCYLTTPVVHPIIESFFVKDLRYQVTRAKKSIRRASTVIYRQTTQLMNNLALDEANRQMDEEEKGKTGGGDRKNWLLKTRNKPSESMITELEVLPNSRSSSPQVGSHDSSVAKSGNGVEEKSPEEKKRTRASVSFQETVLEEVEENGHHSSAAAALSPSKSSRTGKVDKKSALLAMSNRKFAIQEEPDKVTKSVAASS